VRAGWGMLKTFLQHKGQQAGTDVCIGSEKHDANLQQLSGLNRSGRSVVVRAWIFSERGVTHERDVNAAVNMLSCVEVRRVRVRERVFAFRRAAVRHCLRSN
jgi:transposase